PKWKCLHRLIEICGRLWYGWKEFFSTSAITMYSGVNFHFFHHLQIAPFRLHRLREFLRHL
ncbi:MAG: hypothetical protein ACE5L7_10865, partial [Candidatus Aminicenantales bacterium]